MLLGTRLPTINFLFTLHKFHRTCYVQILTIKRTVSIRYVYLCIQNAYATELEMCLCTHTS